MHCLEKGNVKYVIKRLWHEIFHIVPCINPWPISAFQLRCRAWYGSLGLIPGPIWKKSCNNLLIWTGPSPKKYYMDRSLYDPKWHELFAILYFLSKIIMQAPFRNNWKRGSPVPGPYNVILLIDNFTVIWFVQCPSHGVLYFGRLTFADCTATKNRLKNSNIFMTFNNWTWFFLYLATHLNFKHCQVRRQRPYLMICYLTMMV